MATHTYTPIFGKRIRVTALDACGAVPAPGAEDGWMATDGFVSVTLGSEVEDGTEITQKRADGTVCVSEKSASSFKRFTVEITFCGVNPSLLGFVTNATPYTDGGTQTADVIGFTVAEGAIDKNFALELWTGLSGQACKPGEEQAGGYMLLPFVQAGVLGNIEINGENAVTFSLTGSATKGGNGWGAGPFNVVVETPAAGQTPAVAGPLKTPIGPDVHLLLIDTGIAPPPVADEPQPMPAAAP